VSRAGGRIRLGGDPVAEAEPGAEPAVVVLLADPLDRGEHLADVGSAAEGLTDRGADLEVEVGIAGEPELVRSRHGTSLAAGRRGRQPSRGAHPPGGCCVSR
jgi:hypothetical protein